MHSNPDEPYGIGNLGTLVQRFGRILHCDYYWYERFSLPLCDGDLHCSGFHRYRESRDHGLSVGRNRNLWHNGHVS
jgi:hypothetical protein